MHEVKRKWLLIIQTERLTERKDRRRNLWVTVVNEAILTHRNRFRQTQTAAWQVNRVNIIMKSYALKDTLYLNYTFMFRDRESVKVFHNNVNLVYLLICSLP